MKNGKITMINFADRAGVKAVCIVMNLLMVLLTVAPTIQAAQQQQAINLHSMKRQAAQGSRALSMEEMGGIVGGEGKDAVAAKSNVADKSVAVEKTAAADKAPDQADAKQSTNPASGQMATNSVTSSIAQAPKSPGDKGPQAGGGTAFRNVLDGFNVDQYTGAATMSIPLDVPPGRNGMQPNLSLVYRSGAGNSWCGQGWDLDMGYIVRLGANKGMPKYNNTDKYYYVANGSSMELVGETWSTEFRAKIEGNFMRFCRSGNGWRVDDKSGTKYYFGTTAASQTDGNDGGNNLVTYKWHMDKAVDVNGNYMRITYYKSTDMQNYQVYLDCINYTYDKDGLNNKCYVKFYRQNHTYAPTSYLAGFSNRVMSAKMLLTSVAIYANGQPIKGYQLNYSTGTTLNPQDQLTSVRVYGKDLAIDGLGNFTGGTSLPVSSFTYSQITGCDWNQNITLPVALTDWTKGSTNSDEGTRFADVNGDGYLDIVVGQKDWNNSVTMAVYINNKNGGWAENSAWTNALPNINGNLFHFVTCYEKDYNWSQRDCGVRIIDVNADGLPDIIQALYKVNGVPEFHVWLNTGTGWQISSWTLPYEFLDWRNGTSQTDNGLRMADINGDGYVDMVHGLYNGAGSTAYYYNTVYINNKSSGWISDPAWALSYPMYFVEWFPNNISRQTGTQIADVNGDGLPDIVQGRMVGTFQNPVPYNFVWLNNGHGWTLSNWQLPTYFTDWRQENKFGDLGLRMEDINGDGFVDLVSGLKSYDRTLYKNVYINNKINGWGLEGTVSSRFPLHFIEFFAESYYEPRSMGSEMMDVNGDGMTDVICGLNSGPNSQYRYAYNQVISTKPNLLTGITNGLGGTVNITYLPSTQCQNTVVPFALQVVSKVTTNDGITLFDGGVHQYSTNYIYSGGLYDINEREFRGFASCKVVHTAGSITDSTKTFFRQGSVTQGRPDSVKAWRNESLLSQQKSVWDSVGVWDDKSWFPHLGRQDNLIYANGILVKRTAVAMQYVRYGSNDNDSYGNVTRTTHLGEVDPITGADIPGDERYNIVYYIYNTNDWILNKPLSAYVKSLNNTNISSKRFYYDNNNNNLGVMGNKGLLTKTEDSLDIPTPVWVPTQYTYDACGNILTTINALNQTSRVTYDPTNTFVISKTNAAGKNEAIEYYGVNGVGQGNGLYGQVKTVKDQNGISNNFTNVTNTYDVFGRPAKMWGPYDDENSPTQWWIYDIYGVPGEQNVREYTKAAGGGRYWTQTYFDGLGRTIQVHKRGDGFPGVIENSNEIRVTTLYDNWGRPHKASLPYFGPHGENSYKYVAPSAGVKWVTTEYDGLGRAVKVTNPDNTYKTVSYSGLTTTNTDENGKHKHYYNDAYGRLTKVEEHKAADTYTTNYYYDDLGNLIRIDPAHGGDKDTIRFCYDSFGRKIKSYDADRGTDPANVNNKYPWQFEYDLIGNLKKQIDARNIATDFTYDELNRIVTKINAAGTTSYYYDTVGVAPTTYCVGRLGKVIDPSGSVRFAYDKQGRLTSEDRKITGNATTYAIGRSYNAGGQLESLTYPGGEVVPYVYNEFGQVTSISSYATNVTYAASGQCENLTYGNGLAGGYTYNPDRRWLTGIQAGPSGFKLNLILDYYANGNVYTLDNTNTGRYWTYTYDDLYRLEDEICRDAGEVMIYRYTYTYDALGNRKTMTDKNNTVTTYAYDTGNDRYNRLLNDGSRSFTYDANGNITGNGINTYTFNADNRMTRVEGGNTIDYTYNSVGLRVKKVVTTGVDPRERGIIIQEPGPATTDRAQEQTALAKLDKRTLALTIPASSTGKKAPLYIGIDTDGIVGSGNLFLPDAARTGIEAASAWEYCLYVYDRDNYGLYDKDLNTGAARAGSSGGLQYTVSGDKVTIVVPLSALGNPERIGLVAMASQGDRIEDIKKACVPVPERSQDKVLYGAVIMVIPGNTTTTYYLYSESGQVLCEMNSSGAITTKYYYLNGQMVARKQGTVVSYYHNDHLGSPRAITDASGNVTWQQDYYAFGKDYGTVASGNTYKFNDKPLEETGLYNYGARYYDPEIGRFVSCDPVMGSLESPQTLNPYIYVTNNPQSFLDPDGQFLVALLVGMVIGGLSGYLAARSQGITGGWNMFGYIFAGMIIGGVTTGIYAGVSSAMTSCIGSSAVANITTGTIAGAISGGFGNASFGALAGRSDFGRAFYQGAIVGGLLGGAMSTVKEIGWGDKIKDTKLKSYKVKDIANNLANKVNGEFKYNSIDINYKELLHKGIEYYTSDAMKGTEIYKILNTTINAERSLFNVGQLLYHRGITSLFYQGAVITIGAHAQFAIHEGYTVGISGGSSGKVNCDYLPDYEDWND